ncbi:IS630 transposase-related protein [Neisseria yangbaofengii]|uniref:IS630 transposase-related protein n=1 Tax=Neisseria yangbaofengii TaxID=2709396 RepID=UPI003BA3CEB8
MDDSQSRKRIRHRHLHHHALETPSGSSNPPKQRKTRKISAQALLEDVERYPDAYCYERAQRFGCSHTAIHKALKRYNISYKKRPTATRKPTEGSEKTS